MFQIEDYMITEDNLFLLFQILYVITALSTMLVVILENRNPVKTISWVLILVLLPLVGLIVYYFFGTDNRKVRLISHKTHKKFNKRAIRSHAVTNPRDLPSKYSGLITLLNRTKDFPVFRGNEVKFFSNGVDKFEALFKDIEEAKEHIHIQYYIYMDDELGNRLSELLKKKAQEGLEVRLLYDDVGSWKAKKKYFNKLRDAGILVQAYLPVKIRWLASRVNYRNHRKVVVIDGRIGYYGGMNVADRYIKGVKEGLWRDNHVRMLGLGVSGLQSAFLLDWYSTTGQVLVDEKYYPRLQAVSSNVNLQFVTGGPFGILKPIHLGMVEAINTASESIYIQTPYFVPTEGIMLALQMAAQRGVDVKLMMPDKSDTTLAHMASHSFYKDLMFAGVEIYLFTPGFLHSKLVVIDNDLVVNGSANMDVRSFEHNFEISCYIYDNEVNAEAKKIFLDDLMHSKQLNMEEWDSRKFYVRLGESILRLFSPLL